MYFFRAGLPDGGSSCKPRERAAPATPRFFAAVSCCETGHPAVSHREGNLARCGWPRVCLIQRGGLLQLHVGERLPAAGEPVKSCSVRSPAIVDVASVVSMTDT